MRLSEEEAALVAAEATQAAQQVMGEAARSGYLDLAQAAAGGEVPGDQLPLLHRLLEIGLGSGRIRHVHLAEGERTALALASRTPAGRLLGQALEQVNEALGLLSGQVLNGVSIRSAGPARYEIAVETEVARMLVLLGPGEAAVRSVEAGA